MATFVNAIRSEWLKTKNSAASWLCIVGGFLIPLIYCINFFRTGKSMNAETNPDIWQVYFKQLWMSMSFFLLPMGVMLAASLIAQVEFRNNTWKQLNVTPQKYSTIYAAKLSVLLLMTFKFFLYFNTGVVLSAVIPCLVYDHRFPDQAIPWSHFLKVNGYYLLSCIPIVTLQYVISFRIKNFMAPLGIGLAGIVITLTALKWRYIYFSPYSYSVLYSRDGAIATDTIIIYSIIYFLLFTIAGYGIYVFQKIKG